MQADGRGNPPALFDWLALGSQGRGEQLLRTDQDNALIFEDVPEAQYNTVKDYFLQLANYVTEYLQVVGFDYCPADMMASNPKWCLPVSKWRDQFSQWMSEITAENMLNTSIFFDFRGVWGDGSLPDKLTTHIFSELTNPSKRFLASLAQVAIDNPSPLTFFRNFVVERSGEHKDQFDLKSRAMRPLTDAARVLMLEARQGGVNNTFRRFEALAKLEPQNATLYQDAAEAYEVLIRLRTTMGLRRGDSGRFLKPAELGKIQRLLLRNSFTPVKDVQTLLEMRFQLNFLR
jgi:CBS domain-containing protein